MQSILGALTRSVHFVAWSNFTDLGVLWLWASSLLLLAGTCLVVWAAGARACRSLQFRSPSERLVLCLASGLAILGAVSTILVLVGLYRPWAISLVCLAIVAIGAKDVQTFVGTVRAVALDAPAASVLAVFLSIHALMPPHRWDEVSYHLAYPQQWIAAGHVTIDPHLAYPLYTLTWQALLGVTLMTGTTTLAHLLTWLTGVLTAWCIALFLERLDAAEAVVRVSRFAFLMTPIVLSMLDVVFVDVPIMCFLIVAVYGLFMLRDEPSVNPTQAIPAALCAATCVSLKVTNVLFVPLFLAIAFYRLPRRALAAYVGILAAAGGVWFMRNWVVAGDPLTPLLAHLLGRPAMYWTSRDMLGQTEDLRRGLSYKWQALLALPVRVLASTPDGPLRGPPILGYALLLPVSLVLSRQLIRARAIDLFVATWYSVAAWICTTYLIRYAYWIPLAVVCGALVVNELIRRLPAGWRRLDWALAAVLLVGPTPSALRYVKDVFHERVPLGPVARRAYAFDGCADSCAFGAVVARARLSARLYTLAPPMTYYWQEASFHVVSSAFHPGGFGDFDDALRNRTLKSFFKTNRVDYVVLDDPYVAHTFAMSPDTVSQQIREALGPPVWSDSLDAVFAIPSDSGQ